MHSSLRLCAVLAVVSLLGTLSACAQSGPVLLRDIVYQAPTVTAVPAANVKVAVSPFVDGRSAAKSVLGKRTIGDDVINDLVVQGTVADLVTAALKDALVAQGVTVRDGTPWDLETGPGVDGGTELFFGGEIKAFWVETASRTLNVKTKAAVQLRAAVASGSDGKVIRTLNLNSTLSREDVAFSFDMVEGTLSEALSAALNQLLSDEDIQKRIQRY